MTQLVNYLRQLCAAKQIGRVAVDITRRSYPTVWNRVRARVFRMSESEARGYIRARALEIIETEIEALMKYAPRLDAWFRMSVRDRAIEEITGLILADVSSTRRLAPSYRRAG